MKEIPEILRENVRLLGEHLGETMALHDSDALLEKVSDIRDLAKHQNSEGKNTNDKSSLPALLSQLDDKDILPIVRAFNQFLNLANIAEQQYYSGSHTETETELVDLFSALKEQVGADVLLKTVADLSIDLVLTAHPTDSRPILSQVAARSGELILEYLIA